MATAASIVRRALLYVPGSSLKMLDKSRGLLVDNVTYDLEDSVTPHKKAEARSQIRRFLDQPRADGIREQAVRINSVQSGFALDDLTEVLKAPHLDAIVVPKVNTASDLQFVTDVIKHVLPGRHAKLSTNLSTSTLRPAPPPPSDRPPLRVIALIESAKSILNLPQICASTPLLSGLIFAAEDFASDLSLTRTPSLSEMLYARSAIVTHARAFRLSSVIDLVCTSFRGENGLKQLEEECRNGREMGFNGKQLIHPSQVEICQRAFAPGEEEVEWSTRVLVADEKASRGGRGAWTLDGSMVDAPVVAKARRVVERARACGIDVDAVRERWKGQEPE